MLALLFLRSSSELPAPAPRLQPGEVARVRTGPDALGSWFASRFALALEVLRPNVPADKLRDVALSITAQWAHETGRGLKEFNFNLGGWTARRRDPFFTAKGAAASEGIMRFTAYPDLATAVADQLQRLHDTYQSAWKLLVENPRSSAWVEELGRRGYYTASRDTYARAWAMHRAELGGKAAA